MICTQCKSKTKVIDSRLLTEEVVYRRRKCTACDKTFTTYEQKALQKKNPFNNP